MEPRFDMNRCFRVVVSLILIVAVAACDANGTESSITTASTTTTSTLPVTTTATPNTTPPTSTTTSTTTTTTSTTPTITTAVAPDVTPPALVITAPRPGETVTTRTYRFAGTTDPGCTVTAAGRYSADVDTDGNWSIILVLNLGSNLATFTATDPAGNTTTDQLRVDYDPPLVLRADGLGVVSFGEPVDEVLTLLTERLGPPTEDELYESPFEVPSGWQGDERGPDACHAGSPGYICFDYVRTVWWEEPRLWVLFSDLEVDSEAVPGDDDYWVQVPASFQGYGYSGGGSLYTVDGITVGSTTAELLSLGPLVSFEWNPCGDFVDFTITEGGESKEGLVRGSLDDGDFGAFDETGIPKRDARVRSLGAGQRGSC